MTMCLRLAAAAVAAGTVPLLPHTVATTGPAEGGSTSAARVGGTNGPTQEQSKATAHEQMMRGGAAWGRLVAAMAVTETGAAPPGHHHAFMCVCNMHARCVHMHMRAPCQCVLLLSYTNAL
eukprot:1161596-Pelagomonas_calceolata.AAC.22